MCSLLAGLLVKAVVKACECADASTGSLSSYAYTMMVIYFLQQVLFFVTAATLTTPAKTMLYVHRIPLEVLRVGGPLEILV